MLKYRNFFTKVFILKDIAPHILEFAKFFTKVSHTNGRIRMRIDPKIKEIDNTFDLENFINCVKKIDGIIDLKLNLLIGSITVFYNNEIFSKELWNDFLDQKNTDKLLNFLNKQNFLKEI